MEAIAEVNSSCPHRQLVPEFFDLKDSAIEEAYEEGHELVMLPCQHEFHAACVKSWLHRSPTCPSCRHELESQPVASSGRDSLERLEMASPGLVHTLLDLSLMSAAREHLLSRAVPPSASTPASRRRIGNSSLDELALARRGGALAGGAGGAGGWQGGGARPVGLSGLDELEARLQTLMRFERAAALEDAARRVSAPTQMERAPGSRSGRERRLARERDLAESLTAAGAASARGAPPARLRPAVASPSSISSRVSSSLRSAAQRAAGAGSSLWTRVRGNGNGGAPLPRATSSGGAARGSSS